LGEPGREERQAMKHTLGVEEASAGLAISHLALRRRARTS
jgi:hypothetical protein